VFPQEPSPAARHPSRAERAAPPPTTPTAAEGLALPPAQMPAKKSAAPEPSSVDAILARGQAAFDRGYYPEAIRRAREAIAAGGAVPGHLLVADAYYHLQRYADALREYEATLALEPSNALARRGRELAARAAAADTAR
jgi:tetratricopeptide (TPR) repeat protein